MPQPAVGRQAATKSQIKAAKQPSLPVSGSMLNPGGKYAATGATTAPAGSHSRHGYHGSLVGSSEPTRGTTRAARSRYSITARERIGPAPARPVNWEKPPLVQITGRSGPGS